jgi:hypothetical protein
MLPGEAIFRAAMLCAGSHVLPACSKLGGLVIFLEHRFFGLSLPFGYESYRPTADRIGLLSVEQGRLPRAPRTSRGRRPSSPRLPLPQRSPTTR